MIIKNGKVFINGKYHDVDVRVVDNKIKEIGKGLTGDAEIYDANGKYVFAGFIDTHFHGACRANCGESVENMVREVNATQVSPQDKLTDNVYHYDATRKVFELASKFVSR